MIIRDTGSLDIEKLQMLSSRSAIVVVMCIVMWDMVYQLFQLILLVT